MKAFTASPKGCGVESRLDRNEGRQIGETAFGEVAGGLVIRHPLLDPFGLLLSIKSLFAGSGRPFSTGGFHFSTSGVEFSRRFPAGTWLSFCMKYIIFGRFKWIF